MLHICIYIYIYTYVIPRNFEAILVGGVVDHCLINPVDPLLHHVQCLCCDPDFQLLLRDVLTCVYKNMCMNAITC